MSQAESSKAGALNHAQSAAERRRQQRKAASERAAALVRETGISCAQRGALKVARTCVHLYRWGWASPSTLDLVAEVSRGGFAQRLKRAGLVKITEVIRGAPGTRFLPRYAVHLTSEGRERALRAIGFEHVRDESDASASRVRIPALSQLEHAQRVQLIVLDYLKRGAHNDFASPLELAHQSKPGVKHVDAMLNGCDGSRTALELELNSKSFERSEAFIYGLIAGFSTNRWDSCIVVCGTSGIRELYQSLIEPRTRVRRWIGDQEQASHVVTAADHARFEILPLP
jgi:hypothetical protein